MLLFVLFHFDDCIMMVPGDSRYGFRPCSSDTVPVWNEKVTTLPRNFQSYFVCVKEGGLELFWRQHPAIW